MPQTEGDPKMRNPKSKRQTTSRSDRKKTAGRNIEAGTTRKAAQSKPAAQPTVGQRSRSPSHETGRPESKQSQIIAMLRAPNGATIEAMVHATGWRQHSVRGFLAGAIHKKLGLNLLSVKDKTGRIYRITDPTALPIATAKTSQAA
jgi:Protein of unknown function (DUF3489)